MTKYKKVGTITKDSVPSDALGKFWASPLGGYFEIVKVSVAKSGVMEFHIEESVYSVFEIYGSSHSLDVYEVDNSIVPGTIRRHKYTGSIVHHYSPNVWGYISGAGNGFPLAEMGVSGDVEYMNDHYWETIYVPEEKN